MKKQLCTFYLDGLFMGVDVADVQEVIRYQEKTVVPRAPREIVGLMNLRGQIVAAIDLRRRLELSPRAPERKAMNVVVKTDDGPIALLVDEIADVVEASEDCLEPVPETIRGTARRLVSGVYKLEPRLLLVLDTARTVAITGDPTLTGAEE